MQKLSSQLIKQFKTPKLSIRKYVLRLGDQAPNFKAETNVGPVNFYNWLGNNKPKNFDFKSSKENLGAFYFLIQLILHLYVQQNLVKSQNSKKNSQFEM